MGSTARKRLKQWLKIQVYFSCKNCLRCAHWANTTPHRLGPRLLPCCHAALFANSRTPWKGKRKHQRLCWEFQVVQYFWSLTGQNQSHDPNPIAKDVQVSYGPRRENRTNEHLPSLRHSLPRWTPKFHFKLCSKFVCLSTCFWFWCLFFHFISQLAFSYLYQRTKKIHLSLIICLAIINCSGS